jgi:hypothetical protein
VVGTLLSLLVFLSLFGVFLTFYLPLWMSDNEAAFTGGVATSIAELQSNMVFQAETGYPPTLSTPFTMSSASVPLLSVPTTGTLVFLPRSPGAGVSLTTSPNFLNGSYKYPYHVVYNQTAGANLGTLTLTLPNRYFSPTTFEMEDGAVIQSQGDTNQLIAYPPIFELQKSSSELSLTVMLVQGYGNATRLTSPGTIEVYSTLLGETQFLRNNNTGAIKSFFLNITTHYPCAWTNFLKQSQLTAGVNSTQMSVTSLDSTASGCISNSGLSKTINVYVSNIESLTVILATFEVSAGIGVV